MGKVYEYQYYGINWQVFTEFKELKDAIEITAYAQFPVDGGKAYTSRIRIDVEITGKTSDEFLEVANENKSWPLRYYPIVFTERQKFQLYSIFIDDLVWNTTKPSQKLELPKFSDADKEFLHRAIDTYPNSPEGN